MDPQASEKCRSESKILALIEKPEVIKRILSHLRLWPTEDVGRAPPSPASSGSSPTEPHYEPLFDDLPWEKPTFEDGRPFDDGEPTFEDRPTHDGPPGDTA